jgi:uncharacterized membrane protein
VLGPVARSLSAHHLVDRGLPLALGLLFFVLTAGLAVARHLTFHTRARDMGIYVQILWNGAQGQPFVSTLLQDNTNHLAEHVAPALWPLVPLAGLAPDAVPLLVLQQAFLAACGLPIYLLARQRLGRWWALALLLGFYLMPAVSRVSFSEFHPIVLAALPVAAGVACALAGYPRSAALLLLLGLLFEEEAAPTVLGLGALLLIWAGGGLPGRAGRLGSSGPETCQRRTHLVTGLTLGATALVYLALVTLAIMPGFRARQAGRDGEADNRVLSHFSELASEPGLLSTWLTERGPDALAWLALPTGGLALLGPQALLVGLPSFLVLFAQDRPGSYAGHWSGHYLPLIWLAAALGLARLARHPPAAWLGLGLLALGTAIAYPLDSYLPGGREFERDNYEYGEVEAGLRRAVDQVAPEASLIGTRRVVPHLAARRDLYQFPFSFYDPPFRPDQQRQDVVILDLTDSATRRAVEPGESDSILEKRPRYHLQRFGADVLLLSRARPEPARPLEAGFGGLLSLIGLEWTEAGEPTEGPPESLPDAGLELRLFWQGGQRPAAEPIRTVRLLGPDGEVVASLEGQPVDDYLRVRDWDRGQVVAEQLRLAPASPLRPGSYRLTVSWRLPDGRPLTLDGSGAPDLELARLERPADPPQQSHDPPGGTVDLGVARLEDPAELRRPLHDPAWRHAGAPALTWLEQH